MTTTTEELKNIVVNKVYKIRTKKQFSDLSKLIISDFKITVNQLQIHCKHKCGCLFIDDVIKNINWIQPCKKHYEEVSRILTEEDKLRTRIEVLEAENFLLKMTYCNKEINLSKNNFDAISSLF
jgi:hypothetical protein